jgi:hypothetical protein
MPRAGMTSPVGKLDHHAHVRRRSSVSSRGLTPSMIVTLNDVYNGSGGFHIPDAYQVTV